jgi:hypothetical protein
MGGYGQVVRRSANVRSRSKADMEEYELNVCFGPEPGLRSQDSSMTNSRSTWPAVASPGQ